MKLIIDIPEEEYEEIINSEDCSLHRLIRDIANGILILDSATNGDVIKVIFPNTKVDDYDYGKDPVIDVYGIDDTEYITLRKAWWNALYKKDGK